MMTLPSKFSKRLALPINRRIKRAKHRRDVRHSLLNKIRTTLTSRRVHSEQHTQQLYKKLAAKLGVYAKRLKFLRLRRRAKLTFAAPRGKAGVSRTGKRRLPRRARRARHAYRSFNRAPLAKLAATVFIPKRGVERKRTVWAVKNTHIAAHKGEQSPFKSLATVMGEIEDQPQSAMRVRYVREVQIRVRKARLVVYRNQKARRPRLKRKEQKYRTLAQCNNANPHAGPRSPENKLARLPFSQRSRAVVPITVSAVALWTTLRDRRNSSNRLRRYAPEQAKITVFNLRRTGKVIRAGAKLRRARLRPVKRKLKNRRTRNAGRRRKAKKYLVAFRRKQGPYVAWGPNRVLRSEARVTSLPAGLYEPQAVARPNVKQLPAPVPQVSVDFFAAAPSVKYCLRGRSSKIRSHLVRLNVNPYFRRTSRNLRARARVIWARKVHKRRPRRIRIQKRKIRKARAARKRQLTSRQYVPPHLSGRMRGQKFYLSSTRYQGDRFVLRRRTVGATHLRKRIIMIRPYGRIRRKRSKVIVGLNVTRRFYRDSMVRAHVAKGGRFCYLNRTVAVRGAKRRRLRRLLMSTRQRLIRRRRLWSRRRPARKFMFSTGRVARKRYRRTPIWRNWRAKRRLKKRKLLLFKRLRKAVRRALDRTARALKRSTPRYFVKKASAVNLALSALHAGVRGPLSLTQHVTKRARFALRYGATRLSRARKAATKRTFRRNLRTLYAGQYVYRKGFRLRKDRRRRRGSTRLTGYNSVTLDSCLPVVPMFADASKQTLSVRLDQTSAQVLELRAQQLKRLFILKRLLRTNQFTKLAQLGASGVLGDLSILSKLEVLSSTTLLTEQLKQQLLLKVATNIRLAKNASPLHTQYATTTRTSNRALLTYRAPEISYRDENFFISDTPKKRPSVRKLRRQASVTRRLRVVVGSTTGQQLQPAVISVRYIRSARSRGTRKGKVRYGVLGVALKHLPRANRALERRLRKHMFLNLKSIPSVYAGESHSVQTPRLWIQRHGRWRHRAKFNTRITVRNNFAISKPWGLTASFQRESPIESATDSDNETPEFGFARRTFRQLTHRIRALTRRRFCTELAVAPHFAGEKFWSSAPLEKSKREGKLDFAPVIWGKPMPFVVIPDEDAEPAPVTITPGAKTRYHKGLNMNTYDNTVYKNINSYFRRTAAERAGELGYKDIYMALKSAVSSRERTPEINDFQYEGQRSLVTKLLAQLAGSDIPASGPLTWENLPKNIAAVKLPPKPLPEKQEPSRAFVPSGELTRADLLHLYADKTREKVTRFINTPKNSQLTSSVFTDLKKVTISTWTAIETECDSEFERNPRYVDLLVLRKAFRVYDTELPLTDKKATVKKLDSLDKTLRSKKIK